jgi:dienelactone hydrolase
VPFYGTAPSAEEVAKIKSPLLVHYAGNDDRVNATRRLADNPTIGFTHVHRPA